MCGIVGSINVRWDQDPLTAINHRGPDYQDSITYDNVYLGHTRLSIQDLSDAGNQPMQTPDGRFLLIFNGEIYNHWELRQQLVKKGYTFNSKSDSETLLNAWSEWGKESVKRFNGIFAFAIFDRIKSKLYITRDPFGIKPLYFYEKQNQLAFASELKAFIKINNFDFNLNPESIVNYLTFLWSPGSNTMYKYVRKLLPGKIKEIDTKTFKSVTYDINEKDYFRGEYFELSEDEWVKKIDIKLNEVVERQMISDAPLGFFLSGGLDSSLLVAIAKSQMTNQKLNCFTIDQFKNSKENFFEDDLPYAKKIAKELGLSLQIIDTRSDWIESFDQMVWQLDEPQADLAPINVSNISYHAKQAGIKVLLGGVGGDDIFSGYRRHQAIVFNNILKLFPANFLKLISKSFRIIPSYNSRINRLKKLTRDWGMSEINSIMGYFNWLPTNEYVNQLLSETVSNKVVNYNPYNYGEKILSNSQNLSIIDKLLKVEQNTFLIDHNLNYTDKLSMIHGVEVRVPFLDLELVELAGHLPQEVKIKNNIPKYILKKVAEKYLPNEVIYRSKTGFGAPVHELLQNDFKGLIANDLNTDKIKKDNIFNHRTIAKMVSKNQKGDTNFSYNILSLLAIQSWLKQFPWNLNN